MKKTKFKSLITPLVEELKEHISETGVEIEINGYTRNLYNAVFDNDFDVDDEYVYITFDIPDNYCDGYLGDFECVLRFPLTDVMYKKYEEDTYDFDECLIKYEETESPNADIMDELSDTISEMFNYLCYMTIVEDMEKYDVDEDDDAFIDGFDNEYSYCEYNEEFSPYGWQYNETSVTLRCTHGNGVWSFYEIPINDKSWKNKVEYLGYEVM